MPDTPAAARASVHGRIDQATAGSGADALQGHFVRIDLHYLGIEEAYDNAGIAGHRGDYGVFLEPASPPPWAYRDGDQSGPAVDPETGRPTWAVVQLRDETNARLVVPYPSLRRAEAGGR